MGTQQRLRTTTGAIEPAKRAVNSANRRHYLQKYLAATAPSSEPAKPNPKRDRKRRVERAKAAMARIQQRQAKSGV